MSNLPAGPTYTTEVELYKPSASTRLGITLTSTMNEPPAVTVLSPDGMAKSVLQLGDVIISVNGVGCQGHEQTTKALVAATGTIKMLVQRGGEPPAAPVAAPAIAPAPELEPVDVAAAQLSGVSMGEPPPPSFEEAEAAALQSLVGMGFDAAASMEALKKHNGSIEAAANYLAGGS